MTSEERIQAHAQIMEPVEDWLQSWGAALENALFIEELKSLGAALQETIFTENVVLLLIGSFVGGLISWAVSRYFYKKSSKDMQSFSEAFHALEPGSNSNGYHLSERNILHCFGDFEMKSATKEYKVFFPQPYALKPSVEISGDFSRIKSKHVSTSGFIVQVDPAPAGETLRFSYQSSGFPEGFTPSKTPKAL